MGDVLVGYWPLWYPVAAAAGIFMGAWVCGWLSRWYKRRLARVRRSLSELEIARAGRPSPAPIDVEPMR